MITKTTHSKLPYIILVHCYTWEAKVTHTSQKIMQTYAKMFALLLKIMKWLETIHVKSWFNISLSLFWINCGTSGSCSFIDGLLSSWALIWKLDCSGKTGSGDWTCRSWMVTLCVFLLVDCIFFQDMLWMESILFTLVSEPKMVFLSSLMFVLAIFNIGIINSCGCLLLILCNTSNGMIPIGNCLSKIILNKLLVSKLHGVCMEIHVIDWLCKVCCPLVFC